MIKSKNLHSGLNKDMLYYYRVKKKNRFRALNWFALVCTLALVWVYFYPSPLTGVLPEINAPTLPSFPTNIAPGKSKTKPKELAKKPIDDGYNINVVRQIEAELTRKDRQKEVSELTYSLNLLSKLDKNHPETEVRTRVIKQDIMKTAYYFKAGNNAHKNAEILGNYEGGNLAYVYYPNYGVHFNPVTTANLALEQYAKQNYEKVVAITDDLLGSAVIRQYPGVGKYYIWENYFDLEFGEHKFPAPWSSGMAQGLILDVIGKSYKITGDKRYLIAGDMVINSFKVPWNEGGVTDYDEHGNWYLEVAATDKLRILNGFLFTLDAIHNYHKQTGSPKAKKLFEVGISELKMHLQEYDLGYWTNYSLLSGNLANYNYHKIHVDLLKKLHRVTGVSEFNVYAKKFDYYLHNRFIDIPPGHRSFKEVTTLVEQGIIVSKDGWFGAPSKVSRVEFICWLARLRGWKQSPVYHGYYKDIGRNHEDWGYIEAAFEYGVKLGDKDGLFHPGGGINRSEMAAILCKAFEVSSTKQDIYAVDIPSTNENYNAIKLALSNDLMELYELNYFRPELEITREQAAKILYRLLETPPKSSN